MYVNARTSVISQIREVNSICTIITHVNSCGYTNLFHSLVKWVNSYLYSLDIITKLNRLNFKASKCFKNVYFPMLLSNLQKNSNSGYISRSSFILMTLWLSPLRPAYYFILGSLGLWKGMLLLDLILLFFLWLDI